jgi:hypothetical protein
MEGGWNAVACCGEEVEKEVLKAAMTIRDVGVVHESFLISIGGRQGSCKRGFVPRFLAAAKV